MSSILLEKYEFDASVFHQRLILFQQLLFEQNKITQLISRKDEPFFFERHVLECFAPTLAIDFSRVKTVIDLGTGAGLPGILFAILFPELPVILVDSKFRRVDFLKESVQVCGLDNVKIFWSRIEHLSLPKFSQGVIVIARAVSSLLNLWLWSAPLFRKNACVLLAMKGGSLDEEIAVLQRKFPTIHVEKISYDPRLVEAFTQRVLVKIKAKG